jgi:hypothetical protein
MKLFLKKPFLLPVLAGIAVIFGYLATPTAEASARLTRKVGVYGAIAGDPSPSLLGINLGWNLTDFFQVHGGYGVTAIGLINGTTLGGGAKLFLPGWNFSPMVGVSYASFKGDFLGIVTVDSTSITTLQFGFDWQTSYGLYFGFGGTQGMTSGAKATPYVQLGWFF